MPGKIALVPNQMFPITVLPQRPLPFFFAAGGHVFVAHQPVPATLRHLRFNQPPARGKIRIPRRQRPQAMQMVGQQYPCVYGERQCRSHRFDRIAQGGANIRVNQKRLSAQCVHREKITSSLNVGATIVGHVVAVCFVVRQCTGGDENFVPAPVRPALCSLSRLPARGFCTGESRQQQPAHKNTKID